MVLVVACSLLLFAVVNAQSDTVADTLSSEDVATAPKTAATPSEDIGAAADVMEHLLFFPAFFASVSVILVSEIGDKTFFIAAVMAMRHNRLTVFGGAIAALAVMTVLSAIMGFALPNVMPREYTHLASIVLFLYFGVKLLKDSYYMEEPQGGKNEELEEVENELEKKELETEEDKLEGGGAASVAKKKKKIEAIFSPVFVQCFTMTFLAEWGDRSQITTIALAAAKDPVGVTLGGIIGHAICTGFAVVGGKILAEKISEKTVAVIGGILFLFFAVHGLYTGE